MTLSDKIDTERLRIAEKMVDSLRKICAEHSLTLDNACCARDLLASDMEVYNREIRVVNEALDIIKEWESANA